MVSAAQMITKGFSAGRGERSPRRRYTRISKGLDGYEAGHSPSARRERYIGEGGFLRGSAELSASPMPTSLVTFLFGDKKVTLPHHNLQKGMLLTVREGLCPLPCGFLLFLAEIRFFDPKAPAGCRF